MPEAHRFSRSSYCAKMRGSATAMIVPIPTSIAQNGRTNDTNGSDSPRESPKTMNADQFGCWRTNSKTVFVKSVKPIDQVPFSALPGRMPVRTIGSTYSVVTNLERRQQAFWTQRPHNSERHALLKGAVERCVPVAGR